jgi:hypothetical protein
MNIEASVTATASAPGNPALPDPFTVCSSKGTLLPRGVRARCFFSTLKKRWAVLIFAYRDHLVSLGCIAADLRVLHSALQENALFVSPAGYLESA